MNDLENISICFFTVTGNNLISLLLYDDDKFDDTKNRKIYLMSNFSDNMPALKPLLFWCHLSYALPFLHFVLLNKV